MSARVPLGAAIGYAGGVMRGVAGFAIVLAACGASAGGEASSSADTSGETGGTGSTSTQGTDASSTETSTDETETGGESGGPACPELEYGPGDHELTLEHDGETRELKLHVPPGHDGSERLPLLFNLHPWTLTADYQISASGMKLLADAEGFIVVHPQGIGNSWNGGPVCCSPANDDGVDDVGFVRAMIEMLADRACVDGRRVYATGFSNGGYLSYRLACEASDVITAIAPVSAAMGIPFESCAPERPVPTLAIHGTTDALIDYGFSKAGADVMAEHNGCGAETERTYEQGMAYCDARTGCAPGGAQTFCTVEGGGHCWFGQAVCGFGTNTTDIMASDAVWEFLSQYAMP